MIPKLTAYGKKLLLRALVGETLTFTGVQLGNGEAQDPAKAIALSNPILWVGLSKIEIGSDYATLTARFNNSSVEVGFRVTEIGFFVQDPDDDTKEILYALGNDELGSADYIPDKEDRLFEMQFDALMFIGEAKNVSASISSSLVYASKADFDQHLRDKDNPHGVTAEQIGLGNVLNLSPSDQRPIFEETKKLTNINSGEKSSTLFGKIKLAIAKLIDHLDDLNNPHNVTARDVGAAEKSHSHSTADINRGTLGVLRGGTGVTSMRELAEKLTPGYGIPKIITGSYVGDGKYGEDNMRSLTFESAPKLLLIFPQNELSLRGKGIIAPYGVYRLCLAETGESSDKSYVYLNFTWLNETVWWYSATSAAYQLNTKGNTYLYVAFL